jgi:hypothetical protein
MKVATLSALRTGRLYTPPSQGNITGTHFCYRLSQTQDHCAAGRIMSMKNYNDTIGNQTRDLPACSAVPQPTAPQRKKGCRVQSNVAESLMVVMTTTTMMMICTSPPLPPIVLLLQLDVPNSSTAEV